MAERKLNAEQQAIVDAVRAGAEVVERIWTETSKSRSYVSMTRRTRVELRWPDGSMHELSKDRAYRLHDRGLIRIREDKEDDDINVFVEALRAGWEAESSAVRSGPEEE